jgi:hypothetical protein
MFLTSITEKDAVIIAERSDMVAVFQKLMRIYI